MKKKTTILFFILTVLSTVFIFSNSFQSAATSSAKSGRIVNFILRFIDIDKTTLTIIVRKLAHVFEFFLQSFFACLFLMSLKSFYKNIIYVSFLGLFTACFDEFLQLFSDGRGSLVTDIYIDFFGTVIGIIVCIIINIFINKYCHIKNKEV